MRDETTKGGIDYLRDGAWTRRFENVRRAISTRLSESGIVRSHLQRYVTAYHYTNSSGLKGIIESGELWAPSYVFLESVQEYALGFVALKKAIENSTHSFIINHRGLILSELDSFRDATVADLYGFNMSLSADSLSLWRSYGDDGRGYAVGFSLKALLRNLKPEGWTYPVFYDRSEHTILADLIVESCALGLSQPDMFDNLSSQDTEQIIPFVSSLLSGFAPMMKDNGFREEREYRHIVGPTTPKSNMQMGFSDDEGLMVPFIRLNASDITSSREFGGGNSVGKLPISNILVGPRLPFLKAKFSLQKLLIQHGYADVDILPSNLDYLP